MRSRVNGGIIGSYQTPNSSLTSTNRSAGEAALLTTGGVWPGSTISNPNLPPTITSVVITDSNYNALDDTAVNTAGGYMRILGTNFAQNPQLYFNGTLIANSWVSSSEVRVQLPANSAGTGITFMLFNTTTSGGTIYTTGRTYSGVPSVTNSTPISLTNTSISVQFVGSGDSPFVFSSTNAPSGTTLSSSGLLTGTLAEGTYSFTVTVDDTQLQTTTQSYSLTVSLSDVYWNTVGLALVPNPTITGNTFITDSSLNNADLTVFGDTKASPYTPYQTGYYSNYFDGSGDYLSIANTANHDFGTGDFTVEFWLYAISMPNTAGIVGKKTGDATNGWQIYHNTSVANGKITARLSQGLDFSSSTSFTLNTWEYWAITRSGTTVRWFRNGVLDNTGTNSANLSDSTTTNIGYSQTWGGYYTGYISNLRVVKGTALYTATYTSSTTPLVPVSGTQLLTCQSNRLIDNSLNNFTITKNGDTSVVPTHPFTSRRDYGTPYYSTYFDGSADYLTVPSNAVNQLGTTYTIECWHYRTGTASTGSYTSVMQLACTNAYGTSVTGFMLTYDGSSAFNFRDSSSSIILTYSSTNLALNTWYHVAVVRNGSGSNNMTMYINGVSVAAGTSSGTQSTTTAIYIGGDGSANCSFPGYISNFRIVKGTAVYTGNFTAPTSPLTAISGTSLLTCQDATLIDNSTNAFAITSSGQAQPWPVSPFTTTTYSTVSTVLPTYGSAYFDGTYDYFTVADSAAFGFGTGDFTIECWAYLTGSGYAAGYLLFDFRNGVTAVVKPSMYVGSNGVLYYYTYSANRITGPTLPINTWNHVAVSRSSGSTRMFVNGIQVGSTYADSSDYGSTIRPVIGNVGDAPSTYNASWLGYMSNFRVVKGTALYTANFYPSLTPLTAVTNTQLLTLQYNGASNTSQIRDASNFQNLITRAGNANQGTFAPFRTPGHWSVYFDGSGDYLSFTTTTPMVMGTSVFTMEAWVYPTSYGHSFYIIESRVGNGAGAGTYSFYIGTSGQLLFDRIDGSGTIITTANSAIPLNAWTHVAVVRNSSNVWYLYVNGVSSGTTAPTNTYNLSSTNTTYIGYNDDTNLWSSYGYISNLRVVKGTAVYTSNFTPSTTPLRWITNTSLLTCQDSSFIDNGSNLTLTRSGDTKVRPTSPFTIGTYTPTSYSVYFDGTGDYLSITTTSALALGSGDFTVECWIYPTSVAIAQNIICDWRTSNNNQPVLYLANAQVIWRVNATSVIAAGTIVANTWTHLAMVKNSTTLTLYINGVSTATSSDSVTYATDATFQIGKAWDANYWNGYISNLRIVKGQALYTATFTPSTSQLTAVSGTQFLSCQGTSVTDNSSNAFTVTVNGNAVPARHNPFGQTDTTAATAWTPTANGGSVYFDGTGDYLTCGTNQAYAVGTGNFTVEAWVYMTSRAAEYNIISTRGSGGSANAWSLSIVTTGGVTVFTDAYVFNGVGTVPLNAWTHIALVREGTSTNQTKLYVNGSIVATTTNSQNFTSGTLAIGASNDGSQFPFLGYISNARLVKGTAVYTTSFVPSTTPVTSTAATSLLIDANPSVTDWSMNNNLETVGDAKLANQTPYAGSYYSNYFDGTGDYLTAPSNAAFAFGTGSFTIETWIYNTTTASQQTIVERRGSGFATGDWVLFCNESAGNFTFYAYDVNSASAIMTATGGVANTWTHIAVVRNTNAWAIYINGVSAATTTSSATIADNSQVVSVGKDLTAGIRFYFSGYISNLRITKGQALYTTTFTPATSPLTTTSQSATASNVSLLTCQSRTFIDNSSNAFTITRNGDTAVKVQNPFSRVTDYSVYFDGTGDQLTVASPNQLTNFGTGDFTVEFWIYLNAVPAGTQGVFTNPTAFYINFRNSGTIGLTDAATVYATTASALTAGSWFHIAVVRNSSSSRIYTNGVSGTAVACSVNWTNTGTAYIGGDVNGTINGYITELRVSKYARYTTTFTPNTTSDQFKVR